MIPPLCGHCGGRTDGKVSAPTIKGFGALVSCDCAPDTTLPIDGNVLDRVLLADAFERQNEAIETAKQHLVTGLRSQRAGMPKFALECFAAALAALGNLGAS